MILISTLSRIFAVIVDSIFKLNWIRIFCRRRPHQLTTRMKRYGSFVVVLILVRYLLYTMENISVAQKTDLAANLKDAPTNFLNIRSVIYCTNKKLELHETVIGWLETFIKAMKRIGWNEEKLEMLTLPKTRYFNRDVRVKNVNCQAMIECDENEIARAEHLSETEQKVPYSAELYINLTSNCSNFIHERGYIMDPLSEAERDFSVAFSLLMYKDIEQSERLFRAIYRPQNWYCFHVDSKTKESIHKAMSNIADCFENVFILEKRYNVKWGTITVLEPDIHCMKELWNKSKTWKYFINLTGQEFPLRTNYELVQILQAYNGSNDIGATVQRANNSRWVGAGTPPHGIVPAKGPVHITASRGFVEFVLHDRRAKDFLKWTKNTIIPDETFFASLHHNHFLGVPGSYGGLEESDIYGYTKPFVSRFKIWGLIQNDRPCEGKRVRKICVFGTGDLPLLASRRELFANKFHLKYKHYALDCMEELHFNHTRDEYLGKLQFDARWYAQLKYVSNKIV